MSRAALCELLAIKLARYYANDKTALATALTTNWRPTAGAPSEVVAEIKDRVGGSEEDLEDPNNALEVYLITHIIMVEDVSHTLIVSSLAPTVGKTYKIKEFSGEQRGAGYSQRNLCRPNCLFNTFKDDSPRRLQTSPSQLL